jgi:hypothetical protein
MMQKQHALLVLLTVLAIASTTDGFVVVGQGGDVQRRLSTVALPMAGFGASNKGKKKKTSDTKKLKPKQQWDRYNDLKNAKGITVSVRVIGSTTIPMEQREVEWVGVGTVKSKDDAYTEAAVIRQRLLIAEHARRLYPLKFFATDTLEWGYTDGEEEIRVAGKVDMPQDVDKLIGFLGLPDSTGFYQKSEEYTVDSSTPGYEAIMKKQIV